MSFKHIAIIVVGIGFLYALFTVGFPFLLALVAAVFIEPLVLLMMRYSRMNRLTASTAASTGFTLLLLGLIYWIGLKMFTELVNFGKNVPYYMNEADEYLSGAIDKTQLFYDTLPKDTAEQLRTWVETGVAALTGSLQDILTGLSGSFINAAGAIPDFFIFFVVFLVALFLISFSLGTLKQSFLSMFEESSREKVGLVLENLRMSIFGFMIAQMILSILTYILSFIGLLVLKVQYPLAIALLITVVDILPVLGTGSVLVPWAVVALVSGNVYLGVGLIVLYLVITVIRRIVEPKVLGDAIGIGALSTLISLYVGFKLIGMIGLFLGPIVIMIFQAMRKVGLLDFKIKLD